MKRSFLVVSLFSFFFISNNALTAQEIGIKKTISYVKGMRDNDTRILSLMANNTIYWTDGEKNWEKVPLKSLPKEEILDLEVFLKASLMSMDSRLLVLLGDNSIWWYTDGKDWEKISTEGIPKMKIKDISVYTKAGGSLVQSTRIIATLEDNSIYWFANSKWNKFTVKGLGK